MKLALPALCIGALFLYSCNGRKHPTGTGPLYSATIQPLTEAIANDTGNATHYFDRGKALHKLKEDSLALLDYKHATQLDTTHSEYFSAVGDLLFEHKDITGSVPWLQHAVKINPRDKQAHLKVAKVMLFIKKYPEAFSELNDVLRDDAQQPEAYFLKGMIYRDLKDTAKAISSFETALNVQPDYRDAAMELGMILTQRNDSLGLGYLRNAWKMDTTDVAPLYARGVYYQQHEQYEPAKAAYHEIEAHNKNYGPAYFNTGYILLQQDSMEAAIHQYDLYLTLQPNDPRGHYTRGLCYELSNNKQAATDDYKQAIALDSAYAEPRKGLQRVGG